MSQEMPKPYTPSEEEVKEAEGKMSSHLKESSETRERIYDARKELKERGIEVDLYNDCLIGGFYGSVGKINGQLVILETETRRQPKESGEIGGKKISKEDIQILETLFFKEAGVNFGEINQQGMPPKDLQVAAMEYKVRKLERELETATQSAEVIQGIGGVSDYSFNSGGKKIGEISKNRAQVLKENLESYRKKVEDFKESEADSIWQFEKTKGK